MHLNLQKVLLLMSFLGFYQNLDAQKNALPATIVYETFVGFKSSGTVVSSKGDTLLIHDVKNGNLLQNLSLLRAYQLFDSDGVPILTEKGHKIVVDSTKRNDKSQLIATHQKFIIKAKRDSAYTGRFLWQRQDTVAVDLGSSGIILLKINDIENITRIQLQDLEPKKNYAITYNLFGPSGLPIAKGNSYYRPSLSFFSSKNTGPTSYYSRSNTRFSVLSQEFGLRLSDYLSLNIQMPIIPFYAIFSPQFMLPLHDNVYANIGASASLSVGLGEGSSSGFAFHGLFGGLTYMRDKGSIGIQLNRSLQNEALPFSVPIQYRFAKNWVSLAAYNFTYHDKSFYSQYSVGLRCLLPRAAFDASFGFRKDANSFYETIFRQFNLGSIILIGKRNR